MTIGANTYQTYGQLKVAAPLASFVENEALRGIGLTVDAFWQGVEGACVELMPRNQALLDIRQDLQLKLDAWHRGNPGPLADPDAYTRYLRKIGYLVDEGDDFEIEVDNIDPELAILAGPQLVVPINNARYAINAANARWGSLYDALYGTDVIGKVVEASGYDRERGNKVISYAKNLLDKHWPLDGGSHKDAILYALQDGQLAVTLADKSIVSLTDRSQFKGYLGSEDAPNAILLCHHGLHIELQIDRDHAVGKDDPAGIADICIEAALSTIMDCEDSVAAVTADDKTLVYRNWLGLMRGDITVAVKKGEQSFIRQMADDRNYISPNGHAFSLKGRSLMVVRNVGHLMRSDAILFNDMPIFEGIMDAFVTGLVALHDIKALGRYQNSATGSIYIVKPKMHGPDEIAFACELFSKVEALLGLDANTIKIGIMDEERRTSVNLKACVREAKHRVFFINTGFLDRTGDDIHSVMMAGAVCPKSDLKTCDWIAAYERRNVAIGLACGFSGRAQIGKGMWAMPDEMAQMMAAKVSHPKTGATTAWVPSPTAATLHALHYHDVDVWTRHADKVEHIDPVESLFRLPLMDRKPPVAIAQRELDNNAQGLLGYVVRWIDAGIGCSKVPDIQDVGLMEDRATLRISSQHLANWLHHGVCSPEDVEAALRRMAVKVDAQNMDDPNYIPMANDFDNSIAFKAATALVFEGIDQPSGYTEPLLDKFRRKRIAVTR